MVVAVRRSRQALRTWNNELKNRNAAARVLSGDQEAHRERPETDEFFRRIHFEIDGPLCHVPFFHSSKVRKSESYFVALMCHAQITESCAYHRSETQAECRHRGSRSSRRGGPHPHLSSQSHPNQLFPWAATCVWRSSVTGKAEQREPPRLSPSSDRLRERLRSTIPQP